MKDRPSVNKPGADNSVQKGLRRHKLHDHQNNHGEPQKQPSVFDNYKEDKLQ